MGRNDLPKLTGKEFAAMSLLVGAVKPLYGLQMVEMSEGELARGTVYLTLHRLEDKGYITSEKERAQPGIAQPRRLYKATGLGERAFRAVAAARASLKQAFAS
jgi:DNA-binding PadR family transcriptional regulator